MADQDDTLTTPGIGDNISKFGLPSIDEVIAELESQNAPSLARVKELIEKGGKYFDIQDDTADAKATEFLVAVRAVMKHGEAQRVAHKTRYDDIAGAIHGFFKTRIWELMGAAPSNTREEFDPLTAVQFGVGTRIAMAQTLYKRRKAAAELAQRQAAAEAARKAEADAKAKRDKEEADRKAEADRVAKAAKDKANAEAAERKRVADAAAKEAADLAAAAARKRSETNRATADAAAKEAARVAEQARLDQEEADRVAKDEQDEGDRVAKAEQDERDRLALEEENRLAEDRSKLEDAASATTADLSRSRGTRGGVSSLRTFVDFRDLDRAKLGEFMVPGAPMAPSILLLLPYIKDAALESAVIAYEKANKATVAEGIKNGRQPVHGVVFFQNSKSAGRA